MSIFFGYINYLIPVLTRLIQTFLKFHQDVRKIVAPLGSRRVGRSMNVDDEKLGCTVTLAAELMSSRLLPCQIILSGVFGANLSEQYANHEPSLVLFNPTHWQNTVTFCMYLR